MYKPSQKRSLRLAPAKNIFPLKAGRETQSFPAPSTTPPSSKSWMRNANPANQHLPQRGGGTSPARCRPHHRLMRNENSILLSRGYRGGQRPRRTLKGGQGGTIRRFPLLLSLPFQRERKNKKTTNPIFVLTLLETYPLLGTSLKSSFL